MVWSTFAQLRHKRHWTLEEAAEQIGISVNTLSRWEHGIQSPHGYNLRRLCDAYGVTEAELSPHTQDTEDMNRRQFTNFLSIAGASLFAGALPSSLWTDEQLTLYARGIAACQDLVESEKHQVEAILPLYSQQTAALAAVSSPIRAMAARLASQAQQLACELATDREDFREAQLAGQRALDFARLAGDTDLEVASFVSLANIGFHRKLSTAALHFYQQAAALLSDRVTPLLKGRVYVGLAEVYAMRQDMQHSMRAMGQAYEVYPMQPEDDPAYPYLRASRYALYVFGDAQSRLFLGQPKEADKALRAINVESKVIHARPDQHLDSLYYQADVQIQQKELEPAIAILTEGALLAKHLGSRLYFNKLAGDYHVMQTTWPKEASVVALEDVFQPW